MSEAAAQNTAGATHSSEQGTTHQDRYEEIGDLVVKLMIGLETAGHFIPEESESLYWTVDRCQELASEIQSITNEGVLSGHADGHRPAG